MRLLFDTSILIAGFVSTHPQHHNALPWLQRAKAKKIEYVVSAHSIAECYAVLTRLPLSPRISTETANFLLKENVEKLAEIIALSSRDYLMLIKQMAELNLSGGIIYDAIILKSAIKAKVDKILTLNAKDFLRLTPQDPSFIQTLQG